MTMLRAGGLLDVLTPLSDCRQESFEKMERIILWIRICIGFGLAVPPLPHIVVFRVCLYNGFLRCGFLCDRLISVSFPATTPRATTPHRYLTATTPRATTPVRCFQIWMPWLPCSLMRWFKVVALEDRARERSERERSARTLLAYEAEFHNNACDYSLYATL